MSHRGGPGNPEGPNNPGGPGGPGGPGDADGSYDGAAVPVPEGLDAAPVGPELAGLLASTDVAAIGGFDTVEVLKAAYRQATHARAVMLRAVLETGVRLPAPDDQVRRGGLHEFSADEARAALVWSRTRAETTLGFAVAIFERLPTIGEAMWVGDLDEPRARAFCDWTTDLAPEHSARVCAELLPVAPGLMVGELVDRIKRLAIALDPEWAERRYKTAVKQRKVVGSQNPDGTGNVTGTNLPIDRAAAGCDRIDTLARSCKTAGDKRLIDLIRADLFLGMIDGTFENLNDTQIVDHILATAHDEDTEDAPGDNDDDGGDSGPNGGPNSGGGSGDRSGNGGPTRGSGSSCHDEPTGDDGPSGGSGSGRTGGNGGGSGGPSTGSDDQSPDPSGDGGGPGGAPNGDNAAHEAGDPDGGSGEPAATATAAPTAGSGWCPRELRVELATLLGQNDHPGELPGLGYIPALVARHAAARMTGGQWRFVICDPTTGRPICSGITTARPCTTTGTGGQRVRRDNRRGGILELHLTATDLTILTTKLATTNNNDSTSDNDSASGRGGDIGAYGAWAAVIADIADRYATGATDTAAAGDTDPADLRRRRAKAGLRRWVEVRDRYCRHPACRMPATRTDQDHRDDYAHGGLTVETNLDSGCRHDHRLQHHGGWTVTKSTDRDELVWTSPLGHTYSWRPPPILAPLPHPGSYYQQLPIVREGPTRDCGCPAWTCICHTPTMRTASSRPDDTGSQTSNTDVDDPDHDGLSISNPDDDTPPF